MNKKKKKKKSKTNTVASLLCQCSLQTDFILVYLTASVAVASANVFTAPASGKLFTAMAAVKAVSQPFFYML